MIVDEKTEGLRHVLYEMKMFAHTTSYLMEVDSNNMKNDVNVYLESWAIHLRNFLWFFSGNKIKDDIVYTEYILKNQQIESYLLTLSVVKDNIHKYTAHLTFTRNTKISWQYYPTYEIISNCFEIFLNALDSKYTMSYVREIEEIKELESKIQSERNQSYNLITDESNQEIFRVKALSTD